MVGDDPNLGIDKKSKKFLDWVLKTIKDKDTLEDLYYQVEQELFFFYHKSDFTTFTERLYFKMFEGALEHGEPKLSVEQINRELEAEFLDLLGWWLMRKYVNRQKTKS